MCMWYFFNCPECQRPVDTYADQDNDDIASIIFQGVKDHYTKNHGLDKLLLTDDELLYEIKSNRQASSTEPSW